MMDLSALPLHIALPVFFLGGLFLGYGYFRALHATAKMIVDGGPPLWAIALTLGRISFLISGFVLAVLAGALALLATLAGVLCAKQILLYKLREAPE